MKFVDTHTHLYDEAFAADADAALERAFSAGVERLIFPGIDSSTYKAQMALSGKYPSNVFNAMGLHPTSISDNWRDELQFVMDAFASDRQPERGFVAVGEIGLDGYWSKTFMEQQKEAFDAQLELASRLNLPVIIHQRDALEHTFDILERWKGRVRGLFHAFTGSAETYERIKRLGNFKVGIGGVVTFKNASIAKVVEEIELADILLETDSPWLTPAPYRGKRNESSYIPIIAEKIAQIKGIGIEQVAEATTANAEEFFRINS